MIVKQSGLIELPVIPDGVDGMLSVGEAEKHIPFDIRRVYYIYNLCSSQSVRGKHAHKELEQVIFCLNGSFTLSLDDGENREDIIMDRPNKGIVLGKRLWHTMHSFTRDTIIMVLASDYYEEADYIRDYREFREYVEKVDTDDNV